MISSFSGPAYLTPPALHLALCWELLIWIFRRCISRSFRAGRFDSSHFAHGSFSGPAYLAPPTLHLEEQEEEEDGMEEGEKEEEEEGGMEGQEETARRGAQERPRRHPRETPTVSYRRPLV